MNTFLKLAFLFYIGSSLGWVLELFFRRFISGNNPERKWINPGFMVGPYVPLYGTYWGMACASDTLDPAALPPQEVEQRLHSRGIGGLQYYNGEVHRALFALPNFYRDLVRG